MERPSCLYHRDVRLVCSGGLAAAKESLYLQRQGIVPLAAGCGRQNRPPWLGRPWLSVSRRNER